MTTATSTTFKCKAGYICAAGSSTEEGSTACGIDQYCVDGTPTTCSAGTYSLIGGIVSQDECIQCPPGKYCPTNSVDMKDCPLGYWCEGNLSVAPSGTTNQC